MKIDTYFMFFFLLVFATWSAHAQTIVSFDGSNLKEADPVTDEFVGVTFENTIFVLPDVPKVAFSGPGGVPDVVSNPELGFKGPFVSPNTEMLPETVVINFDEPANFVSFLVADLDPADTLTTVGFDVNGMALGKLILNGQSPGAGNGIATFVSLTWTNIARLELRLVNTNNPEGGRWGLDRLEFTLGTFLGDINQDGNIDLLDVAPFVELLTNGKFQEEADINQDGVLDLLDVAPFVELLTDG